jgi:hypothetical protein
MKRKICGVVFPFCLMMMFFTVDAIESCVIGQTAGFFIALGWLGGVALAIKVGRFDRG